MVEAPRQKSPFHELMDGLIVDCFGYEPGSPDPGQREAVNACYRRYGRAVRDILAFALQDPKKARRGAEAVVRRMEAMGLTWNLDTIAKWFPDWHQSPEAFDRETEKRRR